MRTLMRVTLGLLAVSVAAAAKSPPTERRVDVLDVSAAQAGVGAQDLVKKLHAVNELEMRIGQTAVRKARDPRVRRYGRLLWRDHRTADAEVLALAKKLELDPSKHTHDPADQAMLDTLESSTGADFDREFLSAMQAGHQKAIALLESARESQSPALRDLVGRLLPILRQHEQISLNLQPGGRHG